MNQFRRDPITGELVVISERRSLRPREFASRTVADTGVSCPFCQGNEHLTPPTIEKIGAPWRVRCVENGYPALGSAPLKWGGKLFQSSPALGRHEVIIETPYHGENIPSLTRKELTDVFEMYRRRFEKLYSTFPYVLVFHNYGKDAGASLTHLHSQVAALPFLPEEFLKKTKGFAVHKRKTRRCVMCDILKAEKERVIFENKEYKIITPWAAKWKYQVWIVPKKHHSTLRKQPLSYFADALLRVSRAYAKLLGNFSHNYLIHTTKTEGIFHSYLDFFPKLATPAGFEYGSGIFINTVSPEEAARQLREAL